MKAHVLLFSLFIFSPFTYAYPGLDYQGSPIHPGCIRQLAVDLNGDDIVATINLGKTPMRGCDNSNLFWSAPIVHNEFLSYKDVPCCAQIHIEPGDDYWGYRHLGHLGNGVHYLAYQEASNGSGVFGGGLLVKFTQTSILLADDSMLKTQKVDQLTLVGRTHAVESISNIKRIFGDAILQRKSK